MSMRWLRGSLFGLAAGGALLAAATPAAAGTMYRWKSDDGSISYTEDLKRVPERYRAKAEEITTDGLASYPRFTPTDATASKEYNEKLTARLDALRAWNAQTDPMAPRASLAPASAGHPVSAIQLNTASRRRVQDETGDYHWTATQGIDSNPVPTVAFDADPNDPHPVVVERKRMIADGNVATELVTVVRQGDRVLSVIRPEHKESGTIWPRIDDVER
jgi:hypothetical protein